VPLAAPVLDSRERTAAEAARAHASLVAAPKRPTKVLGEFTDTRGRRIVVTDTTVRGISLSGILPTITGNLSDESWLCYATGLAGQPAQSIGLLSGKYPARIVLRYEKDIDFSSAEECDRFVEVYSRAVREWLDRYRGIFQGKYGCPKSVRIGMD
jgi:hypothetical protein